MVGFKLKLITTISTTLLLVNSLVICAQEDPLSGLDDYIKKGMSQWQVPGIAVAVVKDNEVVLSKGYGTRTVGKNQPVDKNTLFAIASTTKLFTASALTVLVGEGKIDWDDRLITRLPGFQVKDDYTTTHATIRDALSHRTGVQNIGVTWALNPSRSRKDLLGLMKHLPSVQGFRSGFHYNNDMYLAAGEIIPEITGVSWDDFIKDRFFKPLGMKNSNTHINDFGRNKNIATPHTVSEGKTVTIPYFDCSPLGGACSINSSAEDMAQWLRFQLNNGKVGDQVIIQEEAINETRRMHNGLSEDTEKITKEMGYGGQFNGYGLGVALYEIGGDKVYHHGGRIAGMVSSLLFVPELKLGIVVLSNTRRFYAHSLTNWIFDRYRNAEKTDWSTSLMKYMDTNVMAGKEKIEHLKRNAVANTRPSLPLIHYAGTYSNELAGDLIITAKEDELSYTLAETGGGLMTHLHFDIFMASTTVFSKETGGTPAQFNLGVDGQVKAITMDYYGTALTYVRND